MFNTARRDRLRPDGRLVRARAEARRHGPPRHRLQQVAVDDRAGQAPGRHRHRGRVGAARGLGLRHRPDRRAGRRRPRRPSRRSATCVEPEHAADGRRLDQARRRRRRAARAEGPHRLVRAGASDRRQGSVRHRPRRRLALPGPPGDPDAAAEDRARAGPEGDRRLGGDRLARAAHDAGGPRRRVRGGEPPAAHPRLRLLQLGLAPARRPRLPLARRPGLSRLHAHRRQQPRASGATS